MLSELVVCSLEAWDDVWRRNQFFVRELLDRDAAIRVLFVEPPSDVLHSLSQLRRPARPQLRRVAPRLWALRPLKALPRRLGRLADELLLRQVLLSVRRLGLNRPVLWLNDVTYAPLIERTGWPTVYDVTDDWLVGPGPARHLDRLAALEATALASADDVVVCSPGLAASRGRARDVVLIPNAVDAGHFRRPRSRPADLPRSPVAVYVGTLHGARLDVELVAETAQALRSLTILLVGPDSLEPAERGLLAAQPNVRLGGPRPYADVPAYLQHADVVIVPHRVSPFTESLDPIKAYECAAVATPTVSTPVAGFRELEGAVTIAGRDAFPEAVRRALSSKTGRTAAPPPPTWRDRAEAYAEILERVVARRAGATGGT